MLKSFFSLFSSNNFIIHLLDSISVILFVFFNISLVCLTCFGFPKSNTSDFKCLSSVLNRVSVSISDEFKLVLLLFSLIFSFSLLFLLLKPSILEFKFVIFLKFNLFLSKLL